MMFIGEEGVVSGSVNRAELSLAYEAATDDAVKENLAAAGAENGMVVVSGHLVDLTAEHDLPEGPEVDPIPEAEPEAADAEPPRGGPGSGRDEWVAYAESLGLELTDDMTRDDIIAAVDAAKE